MSMIDFATMLGHDVGLMIRAFAAAVEDDNVLVRRNALDLILQVLRLDGVAIKKASHEDRIIIMRAAASVVMRRDLSLNRRLYTWLLGPDENAEQQIAYLHAHSLELLNTTLRVGAFI
jgi:Dopey, N-terminal